jgi:hypothetical protein
MRLTTIGIVACLAGFLVNTAGAAPKPLAFKVGDAEQWAFTMDGKSIGTMNATCTSVRQQGPSTLADWRYAVKLDMAIQGQTLKMSLNGTFTVNELAFPIRAFLDATVNGQSQRVTVTFSGGKARMTLSAGTTSANREAAITGREYLSLNNVITLMSLATRALRPEPGKSVKAPFFAVEIQKALDITLAARPKTDTISVAGKKVECVVCDVSPIQATFHVSVQTGELMRYAMEAQKLVIERR